MTMKRSGFFIILAINFIEWLEFSLYLYLAKTVFSQNFFPQSKHSLTLTFALFAVGYLARPVGGWIFGRAADLKGRRAPMVFTAGMMGFATLGICLLPTYHTLGIASTWLLLIFRILQGLAIGGEFNTSAMFMIEHHKHSPLIAGSLVAASGALGMFMGGAIAALLHYSHNSELWRLIFAAVGILSLLICQMRKNLRESPEFTGQRNLRLKELFKSHWRGLVNVAMVASFVSTMVYLCNIYWLSFVSTKQLWPAVYCAWIASFAQLGSALIALPVARYYQPKHGHLLLYASMLTIAVVGPLLFYFSEMMIKAGVVIALAGYILGNGLLCVSLHYFLYQQLPTEYRCRGISIVWAIAASIGAILLPISEQVVETKQWAMFPGYAVSLIAITALLFIRYSETARTISRIKSRILSVHRYTRVISIILGKS